MPISLPRICIALGCPSPDSLLEHARREVEAGETFLEFRLDYLPNPCDGAAAIRALLAESPECVVLATCRRHQNHGRFNGSIEQQIAALEGAVEAGARGVDIETESASANPALLDRLRGRTTIVISYHNYEGTPAVEAVFRRISRVPADAYKIVTTARKPSDIQRILALPRAHARVPMVVLAMGETGFPSRVLSPMFGGLYTYAAPAMAEGTAAGQVCARQLRHLYRIEKLARTARIYGVIADPVGHSISPAVHNRAFQARRTDAVYVPFLVQPAQLRDYVAFAEKLPVCGFSVTIPHKQRIIRYLDAIDPLARRIGAVNTVWRKAGKWRGANTDADAVRIPLERRIRVSKSSVLIAGNGGAARGAAFALADAGAKLSITGRNIDRVRALAKACDAEALTREQAEAATFDAIVHATPLGMHPNTRECFFEERIPAALVFDMVYNPAETELLRRARAESKTVIPGTEMFLEQAVRQFEIWTGETAPRSVMERTILDSLSARSERNAAGV